jgi:putative FmdB family regulatory protein
MPVYVFSCPECGTFELSLPMARAAGAASCPGCAREARRVFTPPSLTRLAKPLRRVLETEEASAHEPRVVTQKSGRPMPQRTHAPTPPWALHRTSSSGRKGK